MVTIGKEQIKFVLYSCTLYFRSSSSEVAASWYGEVQQDFVGRNLILVFIVRQITRTSDWKRWDALNKGYIAQSVKVKR
jgi:hypothetical protein